MLACLVLGVPAVAQAAKGRAAGGPGGGPGAAARAGGGHRDGGHGRWGRGDGGGSGGGGANRGASGRGGEGGGGESPGGGGDQGPRGGGGGGAVRGTGDITRDQGTQGGGPDSGGSDQDSASTGVSGTASGDANARGDVSAQGDGHAGGGGQGAGKANGNGRGNGNGNGSGSGNRNGGGRKNRRQAQGGRRTATSVTPLTPAVLPTSPAVTSAAATTAPATTAPATIAPVTPPTLVAPATPAVPGSPPTAGTPVAPTSTGSPTPATGGAGGSALAPAAGGAFATLPPASPTAGSSSGSADAAKARRSTPPRPPELVTRTVVRTVRDAVEVIPGYLWALLAGLAGLTLASAGASSYMARRARRLARQREALLQDVGLLQEALLPLAPAQIAGAAATAAYRPASSGPAGGDFHDVFAIDGERLGFVVGHVSASGRRALGVTALIRHVLRAYLEGGLQPRNALQVGADVLEHHLGPDYASVTVGVYDRVTSQLSYAGAGMPPPVVLGTAAFEPVTASAPPPIGMGVPTGTRQTSLILPAGAAASFFTDGLLDARLQDGRYGYRRTWNALESLGPTSGADELLDRVAVEADASTTDLAAVVLRVGDGAPAATPEGERRTEELELTRRDLDGERPGLFLRDCGVPTSSIPEMVEELRETGRRLGGAVLRVRFGPGVPEAEAGLRTMDVLHVPSGVGRGAAAA